MSRQKITLIATLVALLAGLLPVAVSIWLAYNRTVNEAEDSLKRITASIAEASDRVLMDIDGALMALNAASLTCTDADVKMLRETTFDVPEISEVGMKTKEGMLVCTSWGKVDPPMQFSKPPQTQILRLDGPIQTRILKRKVIVAAHTRPDGGENNAMVLPSIILGTMAADLGDSGFAALIQAKDGHAFIEKGEVPEFALQASNDEITEQPTLARADFADGISRKVTVARLPNFPELLAVSAVTDQWILRDWIKSSLLMGLVGILVAGLLIGLVIMITRRRLSMTGELERALQNKEFEIHYQPVIELETNRCVGAEALIRWKHPEQGLIPPDMFIPLAEQSGLIEPMTEWLMAQIVDDVGELLKRDEHVHIAINLCPRHFESERILKTSMETFKESGIKPEQITYEITERGLISDTAALARHVMSELRDRNSGMALDDFGTGYSSLSYIGSFPLDFIKIDKQFVSAIGTGAITEGLVDTIIEMAKQLKLRLIAEGIETEEQAQYLRDRKVDFAQGWLFSKPLPKDDFLAFYDEHNN